MDGILLIDKPPSLTSHGVVKHIRQLTKLKVGHSGTLDPGATGVLIIMLGNATKLSPFLNLETKTYVATCTLGQKTDTGDIWGEVIEEKDQCELNQKLLEEVLAGFLGKSKQQTPMVSAVKVKGKKLYEYHRQNEVIETPERDIEVFDIELLSMEEHQFTFKAVVSSGTYIRTLCEDIAQNLGTVGTMSALRRTRIGHYDISQCVELNDLTFMNWQESLISKKDALKEYPMIEVDSPLPIYHGKPMTLNSTSERVVMTYQNEVLAIYDRVGDSNEYKSKRGLW